MTRAACLRVAAVVVVFEVAAVALPDAPAGVAPWSQPSNRMKYNSRAMRKSKPMSEEVGGNAAKYHSYREAWARIDQALAEGFYLEAVTIEESIIADRLINYLARPTARRPLDKDRGRWPGFARLIAAWRDDFPSGLRFESHPDLIDEVDDWRCDRNCVVHRIVKSDPGTPTTPVMEFLAHAKQTAELGARLARAVCDWEQQNDREEGR